jgi:hypothetical protein
MSSHYKTGSYTERQAPVDDHPTSHRQTGEAVSGGAGASPNACQKYLYLATELPLFEPRISALRY